MDYRLYLVIMVLVSLALGILIGRFVLPRKVDGFLVVDNAEEERPHWYIKLFNPADVLLKQKHAYLDVARRINGGDVEWPNER